ncbi:MAG: Rieske 2Fe-2S domain-containing protein [Candidatus Rokuibacteriota bacterium]
MGQYDRHVFVCTSGETCPTQGDVERYVKLLREGVKHAGQQADVRINKAGCFSQCGHGPMVVVYPENVWYAGVKESDLGEILKSHIAGGQPVERLRYEPGIAGPNKKSEAELKAMASPAAHEEAGAATWNRVCRTDEVPANGMKQFSVNGVDVLIVNAGVAFVAYQALCPHEAVALEAGIHDGSVLTCLEHMWQFDVRTGAPLGDAQVGLQGYRLKEERGDLYVVLQG